MDVQVWDLISGDDQSGSWCLIGEFERPSDERGIGPSIDGLPGHDERVPGRQWSDSEKRDRHVVGPHEAGGLFPGDDAGEQRAHG